MNVPVGIVSTVCRAIAEQVTRYTERSKLRAPLVSIVIPCYQQAAYLRAAVDSALEQTHSNVQVIVVNDGSTDGSHEIASSYGNRIAYIRQENAGVTATRNRGAEAADGRYLVFLDADDILDHRAVQWHLKGMEDSEARITVLAHQDFVDRPVIEQISPAVQFTVHAPYPQLIHGNFGPPLKCMCSRKYFQLAGGYKLRSWGCEDWDLWTSLAVQGVDVAKSNVVGAYYRRSHESRSIDTAAMLNSRSDHLANLHAQIVAKKELLELWGRELLYAERRVLRLLLVQKVCNDKVALLANLIEELYALGMDFGQGRLRRLLNKTIGYRSEILALWKWRITEPKHYDSHRSAYI
jgi:glycosyltransferase involved in cell wall biosynthesis